MPTSPPVTVILPAHNAQATIGAAISSTLNQTYTDFELWVLENGSSDHTADVARSFTDPRITVFELGPVGLRGAIRFAIENAPSEWLARMDADDLMFPNRLEVQMEVIRDRAELVLIGTAFALLTPLGHIFERVLSTPSREVDASLVGAGHFFANPSTIFRRHVALDVDSLDPEFPMDDIALWFKMLTRGRGWEVAEPLYLYRLQPNSLSDSMDFYLQQLRVREKYAPQTVGSRSSRREKPSSGWFVVAGLELLSGDGNAVRQAATFLEPEAPRAAERFKWLSYLGRFGYACYRWRHPSKYRYRHRPDWERLFAPYLNGHKVPKATF